MSERLATWARLVRLSIGRPLWTITTALVVTLVLVGGAIPAAYGFGLPHEHLSLSGLPISESEPHHHDNPLAVVLGPNADSENDGDVVPPAAVPVPVAPGSANVLSVYPGVSTIIVATLGLAVLAVNLERFEGRDGSNPVVRSTARLTPLVDDGPVPPPPRAFRPVLS